MRWVTYEARDGERVGVLGANGLIHALPEGARLVDLVAEGLEGLLKRGQQALEEPADVVALADVRLLAPIPVPPSMRDCLCFLDHMRNCLRVLDPSAQLEDTWYRIPAFYFANPASVIGPHDEVATAPGSSWFDVELEVGAVIGRGGRDLTPEEGADAIVGYTFYADWSARDLQILESQLKIGQGKGKDCATTLGPYLVTRDEVRTTGSTGAVDLDVELSVNGRRVGGGNLSAMDWTFGEVISYASRGTELRPGDVFGSGTVPSGCLLEQFSMADPTSFPGWLADGDVVEMSSDVLGTTRQVVRLSPSPRALAPRSRPASRPRKARRNPAGEYARGLHELGNDSFAWMLPDGGYGWSNAGLVAAEGASLLVDTLFDLHLTAEMLAAFEPITRNRPITHAVLTHSNGDHVHGNQLLDPAVTIVAAAGTAHEMHELAPPPMLSGVLAMDLGPELTPYVRDRFSPFDFTGVTLRQPDLTFEDRLVLEVGGREIHVLDLGPAHTDGDAVVFVPDARVLYAGDLLFIGCTPIVWSGPISNWITACDRMIGLDPSVVVPGHGPLTDIAGIRGVRDYLGFVSDWATDCFGKGLDFVETARRIDLGEYAEWLDAERVVVNIYQRYRELDPSLPAMEPVQLLGPAAEWDAARGL